jgi:hypothetical protein
LQTLALTHCPAVEPLRWGLRGIGGSALLAAYFLNIYYFPNFKQASNPSAIFSPNSTRCFNRCKDTAFFNSLSFFYKFYSRDSTSLESITYAGRFFKGFAVHVSQPSNP